MRLLFVCAGNTCRSPMAAAIARQIFTDLVDAESAGVSAADGDLAAANAITVMVNRGMDISGHKARRVDSLDLSCYDRIVALDGDVAQRLRRYGVAAPTLVELNVADPIGSDVKRYKETADQIERELRRIFPPGGKVPPPRPKKDTDDKKATQ